jgi:hypothetical protein
MSDDKKISTNSGGIPSNSPVPPGWIEKAMVLFGKII